MLLDELGDYLAGITSTHLAVAEGLGAVVAVVGAGADALGAIAAPQRDQTPDAAALEVGQVTASGVGADIQLVAVLADALGSDPVAHVEVAKLEAGAALAAGVGLHHAGAADGEDPALRAGGGGGGLLGGGGGLRGGLGLLALLPLGRGLAVAVLQAGGLALDLVEALVDLVAPLLRVAGGGGGGDGCGRVADGAVGIGDRGIDAADRQGVIVVAGRSDEQEGDQGQGGDALVIAHRLSFVWAAGILRTLFRLSQ